MGKIDSEGTFLGTIEESGLSVTQKNSYPQWVARLKAMKKFVNDVDGMKHFEMTEPGYVDWSSFDEETLAYLVLFNSSAEFSDKTKMLNYEQLQLATGWDGAAFDALADGSLVGKTIMFRIQAEEYQGKTQLKVTWIDSESSSPERSLKSLDSSEVKNLTALLKAGGLGGIKKAATPAKPTKPGAATVVKPSATAAPNVAKPSGNTVAAATPDKGEAPSQPVASTTVSEPAKPKGPPRKKGTTPPPPPAEEKVTGLPAESTQGDAWEYLCNNKGGSTDGEIEDAWIAACGEVGENKQEADFAPADWAKVRDIVIKDLSL